MKSDTVGSTQDMEQRKYGHRPCSGKEYKVYRQNSSHNKVGLSPEIIICTGHDEYEEGVGEQRNCNSDVNASGKEGKDKKGVEEQRKMGLVG